MATNRSGYMRDYRKTPEGQRAVDNDKKRQAARRRAKDRLVREHMEEYERYFAEELRIDD